MFSPISYVFFFKAKRALNACHRGYGFTLPLRAACRIFSEIQNRTLSICSVITLLTPFGQVVKLCQSFNSTVYE